MADSPSRAEIVDMLRQHVEAGCTDMLAEAPVNHFANHSTPPQAPLEPTHEIKPEIKAEVNFKPAAPQLATPQIPTANAADSAAASAEVAAAADSLEALQNAIQGFDGCGLKKTAKNTVFCDGVAGSKIMLIGEAPGQDEDREGKPFVGRSGQLLDTMLATIDLSRAENLYISNIVPWRPPGNRTPSAEEIAICRPFIERHIALAKPDMLLLVGNISNKTLLQTETGITKLRGQWQTYEADNISLPALPLLHPAYVLRRPETKADVWADLCALKTRLAG